MTQKKQTALVVCAGRGVYNAPELGYFAKHHSDKTDLLKRFDEQRHAAGQIPIAELDSADRFSISKFTRGDNASGLIYTCSYGDFLSINREAFEIVAVTGNSMGWYTTLACGGALTADDGFRTVNTMGAIMQEQLIGGQIIYPIVDADWQVNPFVKKKVLKLVEDTPDLYVSIMLGGMIVLAGTQEALAIAEGALDPVQNRYPMRLSNHAAFHSPLLKPNSDAGRAALPTSMFMQPDTPMIDGRGHIWTPGACDLHALWEYTFGSQVVESYDFTRAVQTGLKEFAPDCVIVLGPGNTLGGATAQSFLAMGWRNMTTKSDFTLRQQNTPFMLAMGHEEQREMALHARSLAA